MKPETFTVSMPRTLALVTLCALAAACALAGSALAQDWPDADSITPVVEPAPAPTPPTLRPIPGEATAMRSLVMVRDAETGEMRAPNAEEWARLASTVEPLNRSDAGLVEVHHANGMVSVNLEGRFQSASLIHLDPETGETSSDCTHGAQAATDLIQVDPALVGEETRNDR